MAAKYDSNEIIELAETLIEFPEQGLSSPARVVLELSSSPVDIRIEISTITPEIQRILFDGFFNEKGLEIRLPTGNRIRTIPYEKGVIPSKGPVVGLDTGVGLHSVEFGLINFPNFLREGNVATKSVLLRGDPWIVEIKAVDNHWQVQRSLSEQKGFAVTHLGTIRHSAGKSFSSESVRTILDATALFCSFAHGIYCGLFVTKGVDTSGNRAWEQWGVSNVDPWRGHRSWFDTHNGQILEQVFPGFWAKFRTFQKNHRTPLAIEWYMESNTQKASHSSIVLTQAALERLSYEMVGERLSAKQLGSKESEKEGEWIARALEEARVPRDIPASFAALEQLRKANDFLHGPHTIVAIRNDLIHQDMSLDVLPANVYWQAKELGLWYVEMLLLKLFSYKGVCANRLTQEWPGQVEPVPWL